MERPPLSVVVHSSLGRETPLSGRLSPRDVSKGRRIARAVRDEALDDARDGRRVAAEHGLRARRGVGHRVDDEGRELLAVDGAGAVLVEAAEDALDDLLDEALVVGLGEGERRPAELREDGPLRGLLEDGVRVLGVLAGLELLERDVALPRRGALGGDALEGLELLRQNEERAADRGHEEHPEGRHVVEGGHEHIPRDDGQRLLRVLPLEEVPDLGDVARRRAELPHRRRRRAAGLARGEVDHLLGDALDGALGVLLLLLLLLLLEAEAREGRDLRRGPAAAGRLAREERGGLGGTRVMQRRGVPRARVRRPTSMRRDRSEG